jgi:putative copper resistance protein D
VTSLLDIFAFLSVLLRGATLAFEALTVGGVLFAWLVAGTGAGVCEVRPAWRLLTWSSVLLAVTQLCYTAANAAILKASTGMSWADLAGAGFCIAAGMIVLGAAAVRLLMRSAIGNIAAPLACVLIIAGSVMASHSVARVESRWPLVFATSAHHMATAAWIGGLPYLLLLIRNRSDLAAAITARFSRVAVASVCTLVGAGLSLAVLYVGSAAALMGTTYGLMVLSKTALTALLLGLGALNFRIVRHARNGEAAGLLPLQRFSEAEIGVGFTAILVAASLTSTPPAVDIYDDRVESAEIVRRLTPAWPRLQSPALSELSPATPLGSSQGNPTSFVPGQVLQPDTAADIAWSEYNHHWAGLIVAAIGALSLLARRFRWARHWPLVFLALAAFLLVRADSENWPLGPRGFWESFQVAEVAQHRLFVVLIVAFAVFEWAVQTRHLDARRAGLVFPLVCACGGALLMTHSHSLGNVKEEFLAELSHIPLAILGVVAGWSRWLEVRLPADRSQAFAWIWPPCFLLIGLLLLNYRES